MANPSLAAAFVALADPTRRAIFERVARSPASVQKLSEGFSITRPAVSQHLKVLKDARLVAARAEGARRIYRIDPRGVEIMREYLDKFWDRALAAFKEAAEADEHDEQ
jgi:DNA-binding transcriptional ArsR family regulator